MKMVSTNYLTLFNERGTSYRVAARSVGGDAHVLQVESRYTDAFERDRVAAPTYVFDSQFTYDLQPLLFDRKVSGNGSTITFDSTNRLGLLSFAGSGSGSFCRLQSFAHHRYQPGRSQESLITFNFLGGTTGVTKRVGYSDGSNGVELQIKDGTTTAQVVIYSTTGNGSQTFYQSGWADILDGSGSDRNLSGIAVDWTKTHILALDMQALYVGEVRLWLDIDGRLVGLMSADHANKATFPYIADANLPVRWAMDCTSGTTTASMYAICSSVISGGGQQEALGYTFATPNNSVTANSGTWTHVVSLQPALTFNGLPNWSQLIPESIDMLVTGNSPAEWCLAIGQDLAGTVTFLDVNSTFSAAQYNSLGTCTGTAQIYMPGGYISASNQSKGEANDQEKVRKPITLDSDGSTRTLCRISLLARGIGGATAVHGKINWREIR